MDKVIIKFRKNNGNVELVNITNLKSNFNMSFTDTYHSEKDDKGKIRKKLYYYIPNQIRLGGELIDWLVNTSDNPEKSCPANVRKLIHYIVKHLEYNTNNLTISNTLVCKEEHKLDLPAVSRAIKVLEKRKIIVRAKDLERYKNDKRIGAKTYIVNHEQIFNGSYMKLKYHLDLQNLQDLGQDDEMQWLEAY